MDIIDIKNNTQVSENCNFFVARKKRFCKMTVKKGQNFCGEHSDAKNHEESAQTTRINCPLDKKHTVSVAKLAKHLLKCNSRPTEKPQYVVPGINLYCGHLGLYSGDEVKKLSLSKIDDMELDLIIKKIKTLSAELPTIQSEILDHPLFKEELSRKDCGPPTFKHLLQNSSLLGHIAKLNLLENKTCFVEFGAGRGQLSYWLGAALHDKKECMLLLVDRASHRHKFDNRFKSVFHPRVCRVRTDIADLCLNNYDQVNAFENVVTIAKHLCGAATDMALNCLVSSCSTNVDRKLAAAVMAFCCHHRCEWNSFCGKQLLLEHGFTPAEFGVLCGIVSWATCGSGRSRSSISSENGLNERYIRLNLTQEDRKDIGRACKLILDFGRLQFLKAHSFSGNLVFYVNEKTSPENVCLVAKKVSNHS